MLNRATRQRIRRKAARILSGSGSTDAEWSIVLTDDEQLSQLNADFRGKSGTTDVLSFPQQGPEGGWPDSPLIGDVVISVEQAARQAPDDLERELVRLLVHGFCHLEGHDHATAGEARAMRAAEERLLAHCGVDGTLGSAGSR